MEREILMPGFNVTVKHALPQGGSVSQDEADAPADEG